MVRRMTSGGYRATQVVNAWLIGVLCGVVLLACARQANGQPRTYRTKVRPIAAPQLARRGIDAAPIGCWVPAVRAGALGW